MADTPPKKRIHKSKKRPLPQPPTQAAEERPKTYVAKIGDSEFVAKTMDGRTEISDLPRWVRLALVEYETLGLTYKEAAERHGKSGRTLERYGNTPAGKMWRARVIEVVADPIRLAEQTIKVNAANVTLDYLMALQMAIDRKDYKEIGTMSRDILDRLGITKKEKSSGAAQSKPTIVINLGGGMDLERPMVSTSYEAPEDDFDDWEIVEEADGED